MCDILRVVRRDGMRLLTFMLCAQILDAYCAPRTRSEEDRAVFASNRTLGMVVLFIACKMEESEYPEIEYLMQECLDANVHVGKREFILVETHILYMIRFHVPYPNTDWVDMATAHNRAAVALYLCRHPYPASNAVWRNMRRVVRALAKQLKTTHPCNVRSSRTGMSEYLLGFDGDVPSLLSLRA